MTELQWHTMQANEVVKSLDTSVDSGLSLNEAENRLEKYGYNQLEEKEGAAPWVIFLGQFNNFIVWVLIAAAIVSGMLRDWVDALAIIAIVIINAVIGFIQEYKAEQPL